MIVTRRYDIEKARDGAAYAVLDFVQGSSQIRKYVRLGNSVETTKYAIRKTVIEAMRDFAYAQGGLDAVRAVRVPSAFAVEECERLLEI